PDRSAWQKPTTTKPKTHETAKDPEYQPKPAARESLLNIPNLSNSWAPHTRRLDLIRSKANAQYSDAGWAIQALQERIAHRSNSRFLLLFPEPTKNQRLRSTARVLVESARGVKRKTQQSYPHPATSTGR
ncbi:MAG TPA: hypothetical protein VFL49_05445, partial [Pseudolabrys sp.]|nr:hypothetical protein [Pseudolabrys sp.]